MNSWLSGIANKASTLLESVDEYASNSIQTIVTTATGAEKEEEATRKKTPPLPRSQRTADWSYPSPVELRDGTSQESLRLDIPAPAPDSTAAMSDDKLLEYLNDPTANTPLTGNANYLRYSIVLHNIVYRNISLLAKCP